MPCHDYYITKLIFFIVLVRVIMPNFASRDKFRYGRFMLLSSKRTLDRKVGSLYTLFFKSRLYLAKLQSRELTIAQLGNPASDKSKWPLSLLGLPLTFVLRMITKRTSIKYVQ